MSRRPGYGWGVTPGASTPAWRCGSSRSTSASPAGPFRQAMAAHFGVSDKTVKRELPRLVAAGLLEEETLPGRGAPKAYRVPDQVLVQTAIHSPQMIGMNRIPRSPGPICCLLPSVAKTQAAPVDGP